MTYYADPSKDLPAPYKKKRVVVYAQGLKIYGEIPYILQQKLQAKFISNSMSCLGARIVAPSAEDNYTIVRWMCSDGQPHREANIYALLDWLYEDSGYMAAVATREFFFYRLDLPNMWQSPPHTFVPTLESARKFFGLALASGKADRDQAIKYLEAGDAGSPGA